MATLQIDETRSEATFQYTVENFSKMEDSQVSPPCYVRNLPWKILVMPCCSTTEERRKYLSVFLKCNRESDSDSWRCYADIELRLLSHKEGQTPFSRSFENQLFCQHEDDWGWKNFVTWQQVLEVERGYIKEDSITLEAHIVAERYEDRIHRILTETKQEMSQVELSMKQRQQEVVKKIEMLRAEIIMKRDEGYAEMIEEKREREERKKKQRQLEENKWKELKEQIESLRTRKDKQKSVNKKNMIITGLGILLLLIILKNYILRGCLYMYPRIA